VLARLQAAGAELVVGGHIHQGSVCEGREFEVGRPAVLVTTAPGLVRPRPHRLGEACGALAYVIEAGTIRIETHVWRQSAFALTAARLFVRGAGELASGTAAPAQAAPERDAVGGEPGGEPGAVPGAEASAPTGPD
jgi:hypothetical protein